MPIPEPVEMMLARVVPVGPDSWEVSIEDFGACDTWMTVHRDEIGGEPHVGDVLRIMPPHCLGRVTAA